MMSRHTPHAIMPTTVMLWFILFLLNFSPLNATLYHPLVVWHGLGDSHSSPGMLDFSSMIRDIYPGIFIHSIFIEQDQDKDRRAGFFGNVDHQVGLVAEQLAAIPELEGGFDAIGFSQGGQFLRGFAERYNHPPIRNLITFGSQHMGISDIPLCHPRDLVCQAARRITKSAVYGHWAQSNLVQAQYFRDPTKYEAYLATNNYLVSINNEVAFSRNHTYAQNLASLNKLVLVLFSQDTTVVPKESAWFGSERPGQGDVLGLDANPQGVLVEEKSKIIPMRLQHLYLEDWIGLRELDERNGVVFEVCEGKHMQLGGCWRNLVDQFVGKI